MKKNFAMKLMALGMSSVMLLSLAGCSGEGDTATQENGTDGTVYNVAVVKQLDHASLDEIANAVTAELDAIAAENGVTINYTVYSGQNDQTILKQITDQAIAEKVDAIIPIATLAAQVATVSAEESKTPVIFAAVSDPVNAELSGIEYVTGTSDGLDTEFIMNMVFAQNPEVDKVGLLYSLSEVNSETPIAEAKSYLDEKIFIVGFCR